MQENEYKEWQKTLTEHKKLMEQELAEVRKAKMELFQMQRQLQEMVFGGRYERDEDTLILSAPKIIIGNVDKQGNMLGDSTIILRGNDVSLEGVGRVSGGAVSGGTVTTRARYVNVQTVDPGPDGQEAVAFSDSSFKVQTAAIGMSAETIGTDDNTITQGVFTLSADASQGNINLGAESNIRINAAVANPGSSSDMAKAITEVDSIATTYSTGADNAIKEVEKRATKMDEVLKNNKEDMLGAADDEIDNLSLRAGMYKFKKRSAESSVIAFEIAKNIISCTNNMSNMSEAKRVKSYLEKRKTYLEGKKSKYEKEATGSSVTINSETVNITTAGADGKLRTSPNNGLKIRSQHTSLNLPFKGETLEDTTLRLFTDYMLYDTSTYKFDDEGKLESSNAAGLVEIISLKTGIKTVDRTYKKEADKNGNYDVEAEEIKENSKIWMNTYDMSLDMTDTKGDTFGNFRLNAKDITITASKWDSDKGTASAYPDDSKIQIGSKEVYVGSLNDDMKCDTVQVASVHSVMFGEEDIILQHEKADSKLILNDKAELCSGDVSLIGNITLGGATEVKDKLTAGDIDAKNVNASGSINGPNLKDGMNMPGPAQKVQGSEGREKKKLEDVQVKIVGDEDLSKSGE